MSAIYRQRLAVEDYQELEVTGPVISVAADRDGSDGHIDLWYEDNTSTPGARARTVGIYILGTGHTAPWDHVTRGLYQFVGTVVTPGGFLIWHVYTGPARPR